MTTGRINQVAFTYPWLPCLLWEIHATERACSLAGCSLEQYRHRPLPKQMREDFLIKRGSPLCHQVTLFSVRKDHFLPGKRTAGGAALSATNDRSPSTVCCRDHAVSNHPRPWHKLLHRTKAGDHSPQFSDSSLNTMNQHCLATNQ